MVKGRNKRMAGRPGDLPQAIADWKKRVETRLTGVFGNYSQRLPLDCRPMRQAVEILKEFSLRSASKRIRAFLVKVGYEASGRQAPPALIDIAAAIELLQVYLLIHDDIIDREITRRGGPTVHQALFQYFKKQSGGDRRLANDLAILIGDLAFSWSMHLITDSTWPAGRRLKAMAALLSTHEVCVGGQYLDVLPTGRPALTKRHVIEIASRKTASYTFVGPLTVGAVLAGAPKQAIQSLTRYGQLAGLAFQWVDDLNDLTEALTSGKLSSDIQERKITAVVMAARRRLNPADRRQLDKLIINPTHDQARSFQVQRLIRQARVETVVRQEASRYLTRGLTALQSTKSIPRPTLHILTELGQYVLGLTRE